MLWSNINPTKPLTLKLKSPYPPILSSGRDDHPGRPSSFPDGKERKQCPLIQNPRVSVSLPLPAWGPQPRGKIRNQIFIPFYATRATCHQKAAATADKIDSSGTAQAQPKQRPVQLAPANAASNPNGLRMACPWPPDQIQL